MTEEQHNAHQKDVDSASGIETTGHEWDGIKELNNPLPRWWLWVFYITIVWSVGYWIIYPAWPVFFGENERGGTKGSAEWTQYKKLEAERQDILDVRNAYAERFRKASFEEIKRDPELYAFALAGGKAAFKDNCTTCHGTGGAGAKGYPNLNDDDWIWGGSTEEIYRSIKYGIRMHDEARQSMMPAYAGMFSHEELSAVAEYVQYLGGNGKANAEGATLFAGNCAACHGDKGTGNRELGAPNLADAIWLKSEDGSKEAIIAQMKAPKHGEMPAWVDRLDDDTIRQLTLFVHELGGGE